ncbi:MAG: TetR family transcriptional regulator [Thermaceae bacterium]
MRSLIALLILSAAGVSGAQGVRSLGMGGLVLPGPGIAHLNPAYAAYPGGRYGGDGGFVLPLGLLGLLLRPEANPLPGLDSPSNLFREDSPFDLLTFYDQLTHLDSFLLNPPSSGAFINPDTGYPEIQIRISAQGVEITDYQGNPIALDLGGLVPPPPGPSASSAPLLRLPFSIGDHFSLGIGVVADVGGIRLSPNEYLQKALEERKLEANTEYAVSTHARAQAGLSLDFNFATPLPELPDLGFGPLKVYLGTRGEVFYGLGQVSVEGFSVGFKTDDQAQPSQQVYNGKVFYAYPGAGGGFGGRADLGVVLEVQDFTLGVGLLNLLSGSQWSGTELVWENKSDPRDFTSRPAERGGFAFAPSLFFNLATQVPLEVGSLFLGADLGIGDRVYGHLGGEYALGIFRLRTGLGFDEGVRLGLGAGLAMPGFSLDAALTTHRAPIVGETVYGIAASLGFAF